jgi:hypothetical protein
VEIRRHGKVDIRRFQLVLDLFVDCLAKPISDHVISSLGKTVIEQISG